MNRTAKFLLVGALGIVLTAPYALAQSRQDIERDNNAIQHKEEQIHHDRRERNEDLRNGDYHAARREQREINGRKEKLQNRQEDLNEDMSHSSWHHHDEDEE
jgi:DNA anti-recombination protein RmuC